MKILFLGFWNCIPGITNNKQSIRSSEKQKMTKSLHSDSGKSVKHLCYAV